MRYHIDTIPVWDAYKAGGECPLCALRAENEQAYVDNFLGGSVMEPDVRIEVNAKGFCGPHFAQMITRKNRLGLALMTHTHLKETMQGMQTVSSSDVKRRGVLTKRPKSAPATASSCVLCERLENTMARYLYTVLHLWKTDAAFRKELETSKGLCLPHYQQITQMAREELSAGDADRFVQTMERLEKENLARIEKELEWFTLKFDYRNADAPWGESKDALERAINKLRGKYV